MSFYLKQRGYHRRLWSRGVTEKGRQTILGLITIAMSCQRANCGVLGESWLPCELVTEARVKEEPGLGYI